MASPADMATRLKAGSHGGFNRINELNDRITAFIQAHATGKQAAQPTPPPATSAGAVADSG